MSENVDNIETDDLIDETLGTCVEAAVNMALDAYMEKLQNGELRIESEASFQHHLALFITHYLDDYEHSILYLEKKYKLNKGSDYVDIVIEYKNNKFERECLIELKFKKEKSGINKAILLSFADIYDLEQLKSRYKNVKFCYFIFLTHNEIYTKKPQNEQNERIRTKFPMWDGARIILNQIYKDDSKTAESVFKKYPKGFKFKHSYDINYQKITTHENKNLWFFKLQIPPRKA